MSRRKKPRGSRREPLRLRLLDGSDVIEVPAQLPLLPLRDVVLFPLATLPLFVGRAPSVKALEAAIAGEKLLFAVTQRRPETTAPAEADLHTTGTVLRVLQLFRLPDGTMRILVEGLVRAQLVRCLTGETCTLAEILPFEQESEADEEHLHDLVAAARDGFERYVELNRRIAPEVGLVLRGTGHPRAVACKICANLHLPVMVKQRLLEIADTEDLLREIGRLVSAEVRDLSDQERREMRAGRPAHRDLLFGDGEDSNKGAGLALGDCSDELEELAQAIEAAEMPKAVEEKAFRELDRLGKMPLVSPEATVCRTYLDWLIHIPWHQRTRDRTTLARVEKILDEDHYGLRKVKERVLEQISVIKLSREVRGPILCLTGPPGVGKTSLGRSIARALGRAFVRMSLGGIRDESEIRGHRRTYIGSLPGRIIQAMRKAGSINPVILLDEVDKLGSDHRGDPAAALLEVLDPEQNSAYNDHYLEVDYDLSKVLFITTANLLHAIPEPLRDRMEVIRIPGYLETEKLQIAKCFLLPRQRKMNGLVPEDLDIPDATLVSLIREYTREAGVRNLEREIARLCRRAAKVKAGGRDKVLGDGRQRKAGDEPLEISLSAEHLRGLLGPARYEDLIFDRASRVGVATGLAWTSAGGELLTIEAGVLPGRGTLLLTGQLGETMRESAQAALSYIRSRSETLGLGRDFYRRIDLHVHVPEGAVPKDGPSAGVTLALAMISALTGIPTRASVAMTGEITLRGNVLQVGGIGEKIVAARRAGITTIALPRGNHRHIGELPRELIEGLELHPLETIDEALTLGLERRPAPRLSDEALAPPAAA